MSRCKATSTQLAHLVEFMKMNSDVASGRGTGLQGRVALEQQWKKLAETLNALGGPVKSVEKWKQTWRDLRNGVKKKALKNKREQKGDGPGGTGNGPSQIEDFTAQDEAVISVITPIAVYGMNGIPCTMPVEDAPGSPAVVVPTILQPVGDASSVPPAVMPAPQPEPSPMCSTQDAERSSYVQLPPTPAIPMTPSLPQPPLRPRIRSRRRLAARTETFDSQILEYEKERLEVQQRQIAVEERKLELEERRLIIEDRKVKAFERIATALEQHNFNLKE